MKKLLFLIIILALGLFGCASMEKRRKAEAEFKAQIKAYNASVTDPRDKIICKKIVPTGSRVARRVCATRREWAQGTAESQEAIRKLRPGGGPPD